jgi:hypothetical protein
MTTLQTGITTQGGNMITKKRKNQTVSRAAKRARFVAQQEKKPGGASPVVLITGLVIALALIGGTVFALTRPSPATTESPADVSFQELSSSTTSGDTQLVTAATSGHDPYPLAAAENGAVRFPLSTFDDYQAHHYTYMHKGRAIEFFVLKSKDGVVRAAFNACDVCFLSKKGYIQDGDEMVCINCGRRFPADQINEVHGGCNPSPLRRTVEGDTLVIQEQDIINGMSYF